MTAIRTFLAAPVDDELADRLDGWIETVAHDWPDASWAPRDTRHLTLKFLGQVEPDVLDEFGGEVASALRSVPAISVPVTHAGPFPANARSHLVAAHLSLPDPLAHLADGLDGLAAGFGVAKRKRSFRPHITLGRQSHRPDTGEAVLTSPLEGSLRLDRIVLYRSDTLVEGRGYTPLTEFHLAQPTQS